MNTGFTLFFYGLSAILLSLSFRKDREKTNRAVRKALFMMLGVLPYFLIILLVTGTAFFILPSKTVQTLMGTESGIRGMLLAAVTGAAALVPVLAVFPVVSELLKNGAGTAHFYSGKVRGDRSLRLHGSGAVYMESGSCIPLCGSDGCMD